MKRPVSDTTSLLRPTLDAMHLGSSTPSSSGRPALAHARKSTKPRAPSTSPSPPEIPAIVLTAEEKQDVMSHARRFVPDVKSAKKSKDQFEEMMRACSARDHAPNISVINTVDNDPCPPPDFLFTNEMIQGMGVPRSDQFSHCDCSGPCDPNNQECLCSGLQKAFIPSPPTPHLSLWDDTTTTSSSAGFLYNPNGTLRESGIRIYECNRNCLCSATCNNKVHMLLRIRSVVLLVSEPPRLLTYLLRWSSLDAR